MYREKTRGLERNLPLDTVLQADFPICVFSILFLYDTMTTQTIYVTISYIGEDSE